MRPSGLIPLVLPFALAGPVSLMYVAYRHLLLPPHTRDWGR